MSNKSMKEVMTEEVIDVLQTAVKNHRDNQKAKKNDTQLMQQTIKDLEAYVKQFVKSDFEHFSPAIYTSLGLRPPVETKIVIQPRPQPPVKISESSEEDTESSVSNNSSPRSESETSPPRKKQLQQSSIEMEYYDSEETGHTVNVEESPAQRSEWKKSEIIKSTRNPIVELGKSRAMKVAPNPSTIKDMEVLLRATAAIDPRNKTSAMLEALIDAEKEFRKNPSNALKLIIDQIGTEANKWSATARTEVRFLNDFMKIKILKDVIMDPTCRAVLENKVKSLPSTQQKAVVALLESTTNLTPPSKK